MWKRLAYVLGIGMFMVVVLPSVAAAAPFKNQLSRADWIKFGVNPWRLDTDNDGFSDYWEVKNAYCPTSAEKGLALKNSRCQKGTINFAKQRYTPPAALKELYPRSVQNSTSCSNLQAVIKQAAQDRANFYKTQPIIELGEGLGLSPSPASGLSDSSLSTEFSGTNVQVAGVDEGDTVKTDGKYVYYINDKKLFIALAAPAAEGKLLSATILKDITPREIYVSGDYLVVIGTSGYDYYYGGRGQPVPTIIRPTVNSVVTAQTWNIRDRFHPKLIRTVEAEGSLLSSRLTNGYVYLVLRGYPDNRIAYPATASKNQGTPQTVPLLRDRRGAALTNDRINFSPAVPCAQVQYIAPVEDVAFLEIFAVPVANPLGALGKKVVFGAGDDIYMSKDNLYITSASNNWWRASSQEKTEIYKFNLRRNQINLVGSQTVPGTVLNQFSMDEYKGVLRLATTVGSNWQDNSLRNNLYFFDADLNRIGWYEGFGPFERIYSARFVGNRAYIVTFRQIDPLFVFDVSSPYEPKELGRLKIPGYSTYLHPYDDNHLIGLGYDIPDTTASSKLPLVEQGLKLSFFDVSDPKNPQEKFKETLGAGSFSQALYDHHAFLFSREKNLLAIPALVVQSSQGISSFWSADTLSYQGLFVYKVDPVRGFQFKGGINHIPNFPISENDYSGSSGDVILKGMINRSLYIGNTLYALSMNKMTAHNLNDLSLLKEVIFEPVDYTFHRTPPVNPRDSKRLADLRQLQTALELYFDDQNAYPVGNGMLGVGNMACLNAQGWQAAGCSGPYMGMIPTDPNGGSYMYSSGQNTYSVTATLEGEINGLSGNIVVTPSGIAD